MMIRTQSETPLSPGAHAMVEEGLQPPSSKRVRTMEPQLYLSGEGAESSFPPPPKRKAAQNSILRRRKLVPPKGSSRRGKKARKERKQGTLETRLSEIAIPGGAGLGLFAVARPGESIAFSEGERVLTATGCIAMRVVLPSKQQVEWLYHDGTICGLRASPHTMWSSKSVEVLDDSQQPPVRRMVELGRKNDDLSINANDSNSEELSNIKCLAVFQGELVSRKVTHLTDSHNIPLCFHLIAKRDIKDKEECLWHYKSKMHDYSEPFVETFSIDEHGSMARACTAAVFDDIDSADTLEVTTDQQSFDEKRWKQALFFKLPDCPITKDEEPFYERLVSDERHYMFVSLEVAKSRVALSAYCKYKINKRLDEISPELLGELIHQISLTLMSRDIRINDREASEGVVTDFCIDIGLIDPDHAIAVLPWEWITLNMANENNSLKSILMLKKRLVSVIIKPNFAWPNIVGQLVRGKVKNPLKDFKVEWSLLDVLTLAGHPGNLMREEKEIKRCLAEYEASETDRVLSGKVYHLARIGNEQAVLGIIRKILVYGSQTIRQVSEGLIHAGVSISLDHQMVLPTLENLTKFCREKLTAEERVASRRHELMTDEELLGMLDTEEGCFSRSFTKQIGFKATQLGQSDEGKAFALWALRLMVKSVDKKEPARFLKKVETMNRIVHFLNEPITPENIWLVFTQPEDQEWLKRFYLGRKIGKKLAGRGKAPGGKKASSRLTPHPVQHSSAPTGASAFTGERSAVGVIDEETKFAWLIEMCRTRKSYNAPKKQVLELCDRKPDRLARYLKAAYEASTMGKIAFCSNKAAELEEAGCRKSDGNPYTSFELRDLLGDVAPKTKAEERKQAESIRTEQEWARLIKSKKVASSQLGKYFMPMIKKSVGDERKQLVKQLMRINLMYRDPAKEPNDMYHLFKKKNIEGLITCKEELEHFIQAEPEPWSSEQYLRWSKWL